LRPIQNNIGIAILTKVNELAEQYGVKPYEFVAAIYYKEDSNITMLRYESVPPDEKQQVRFFKMLDRMGVGEQSGELEGTSKQIIDALDEALQRAPKPRGSEASHIRR
jgi:hypothetical protein